MLSKPSKYAIRSVLFLATEAPNGEKLSPLYISKKMNIPASFLAKTLQVLVKNKLISSIKGRNGGFYLTEENKKNSLLSIVKAYSDSGFLHDCFLGLSECKDDTPCPIHFVIKPLKTKFLKELSSTTINDLLKGVKEGKTYLSLSQDE